MKYEMECQTVNKEMEYWMSVDCKMEINRIHKEGLINCG